MGLREDCDAIEHYQRFGAGAAMIHYRGREEAKRILSREDFNEACAQYAAAQKARGLWPTDASAREGLGNYEFLKARNT